LIGCVVSEGDFAKLEKYAGQRDSEVLAQARQAFLNYVADLCSALRIAVVPKDYRVSFPDHIKKVQC